MSLQSVVVLTVFTGLLALYLLALYVLVSSVIELFKKDKTNKK